MNLERVEKIAEAVLYEGYMLYPYRPSSVKNQQRWNFGVVCPQSYCEAQPGSERSFMQAQCLLGATPSSRVTIEVRFLQIVERLIGRFKIVDAETNGCAQHEMEFVDKLEIEGRKYQPWQEAVERAVVCGDLDPALGRSNTMEFSFPSGDSCEEIRDSLGSQVGAITRQWQHLSGVLQMRVEGCRDDVVRLTARVENRSEFDASAAHSSRGRDAAMAHSLISTHIILGVEDGEFLSLLDPPAGYEEVAAACENVGVWPVLAGGDATTMLASPIILYDDPKIAPESAGNLFDSTEIDEILSLRILTLTDQEKLEIRQSDERARELLERTESIPDEQFLKLHGVLRGLTAGKGDSA